VLDPIEALRYEIFLGIRLWSKYKIDI
jgi:hypothetical protein